MEGIKPCPYCGGEIEMVKLGKTVQEKKDRAPHPYRIECRACHRLVARGQKFPIETAADAQERINDYNKYMDNKFAPSGWGHKQTHGESKYDG